MLVVLPRMVARLDKAFVPVIQVAFLLLPEAVVDTSVEILLYVQCDVAVDFIFSCLCTIVYIATACYI